MPEQYSETQLYRNKREQLLVFVFVAIGIFMVSYGFFFVIDFLPEAPKEEADTTVEAAAVEDETTQTATTTETVESTQPIDPQPDTIIIDKLDREVRVLNPDSRAVADLDTALLEGVVRHPDSADFERDGTMFLFGHSSYLPHVVNKNFQAFNGIQELTWGDTVRVQSSDREYVYRVDRVYQVRASEAEVEIERGTPKLTLVTCNSFGSKDDRYIVEASLVDERPIE